MHLLDDVAATASVLNTADNTTAPRRSARGSMLQPERQRSSLCRLGSQTQRTGGRQVGGNTLHYDFNQNSWNALDEALTAASIAQLEARGQPNLAQTWQPSGSKSGTHNVGIINIRDSVSPFTGSLTHGRSSTHR